MALLTTTFSNVLNNRNYYARIYPVNPQGSMQSELYGQVTTDAVTPTGSVSLGQLSEGSIVMIPEDGVDTAFYVAKHDYESGLNSTGRVLMVRKDVYDKRQWHTSEVNAYASSAIDTWLNGDYKALLDGAVQEAIGTTKFYYTPGNGNKTVSSLSRGVFILSLTELNKTCSEVNTEGSTLPIASTLQTVYLDGTKTNQWTRSPTTSNKVGVAYISTGGTALAPNCINTFGARPCFTLPSDMQLSKTPNDDGSYNILTFPSEPSSYSLINTYTKSQTWTAPEDGWYQIELFGASGSGGAAAIATYANGRGNVGCAACSTGGGGGSGAYAMSQVALNKGDTIVLADIAVGSTATVEVNSTKDTAYSHTMKCVSGKSGSKGTATTSRASVTGDATVGAAGSGGKASGGLNTNTNGKSGSKAGTSGVLTGSGMHDDYELTQQTAAAAGGSAVVTGGNSGGAGGRGQLSYYWSYNNIYLPKASQYTAAGSGRSAFMKIYRGNTNVIG